MSSRGKTKSQLLSELADLRRRLAALEEVTAEQQRMDGNLRQLRNFLRGVIEAIPEVTLVVDRDFRVVLANKAARERVGGEDPVSAGLKCFQVSRHRDVPCQADEPCPLAYVLEHKTPITVTHTHFDAQGREVIVEVSAAPIFDETDEVVRVIESCCDITERTRAEEALRRERDFNASLIESAHSIVLVVDAQDRIVQFNSYLEELSGYRLEDVRGRDWLAVFVPEREAARVRALSRQALQNAQPCSYLSPIVTRAGQEREIAWFTKALQEPPLAAGRGPPTPGETINLLSIGHDISELRAAQQRLVQQERLAAIGEAMTGLAHESRNALQRSQACLEMLASRVEDRPEAQNLIARIQQAQNHLHHLFEEVREYAAPIVLRPVEHDLRQLLRETWELLAAGRGDRLARLLEIGAHTSRPCEVDWFAVQQVFRNVLENAIDACREPMEIEVQYEAADVAGQPGVRIAIRDNGPGLTPEQQRRIFDAFYTTKTQGTGLGMAIAKRLVEAHGGRMEATSQPGSGTEILITLPRRLG